MPHETPLITAIVIGLCLAFIFGIIANRLRISPLVGYLLAGVIVGPHTGGFSADPELTNQLAEIGVILLMFGVGLHFSLKDLLSVKSIAVPGAIVQMAFATLLGLCLGLIMGWGFGPSLVFGLALSTASTVVLLRALQERRLIDSERGRIAVGWLIVEDLAMVFALVLVPALSDILGGKAGASTDPLVQWLGLGLWGVIGLTLVKVMLFIAVMLIVGRRVIPWILKVTAQSGSRELFRLGVLAIALGVAFGAAQLFGVSLALGAFFAGMIMSESELSHRAAEESLPLRDAFAVLFFVSVGMLFDPSKFISLGMLSNPMRILTDFLPLIVTLLIIVFGKSFAAYMIVRVFRHPVGTALTISASLAQIGEFSFILATLGGSLGLLPPAARDLIVGSAILSILLNPLVFILADKIRPRLERDTSSKEADDIIEITPDDAPDQLVQTTQQNHTIIIGYGRVGSKVGSALKEAGQPILVIEEAPRLIDRLRDNGIEVVGGNGVDKDILHAANIENAKQLVVAMRHTFEAGQIIAVARAINKPLKIVAHALSDAETKYLLDMGADIVVTDDEEIAKGMVEYLSGKRTTDKAEPNTPEDTPTDSTLHVEQNNETPSKQEQAGNKQ